MLVRERNTFFFFVLKFVLWAFFSEKLFSSLTRIAEFDTNSLNLAVVNLPFLMKGNHFENSQAKETETVKWQKEVNHNRRRNFMLRKLPTLRSLRTTSKNTTLSS